MFDSAIYKNRRQALRNKVQKRLILILGNNEAPANYPDNTYNFVKTVLSSISSVILIRDMQE